jgi:hypothetical protein
MFSNAQFVERRRGFTGPSEKSCHVLYNWQDKLCKIKVYQLRVERGRERDLRRYGLRPLPS